MFCRQPLLICVVDITLNTSLYNEEAKNSLPPLDNIAILIGCGTGRIVGRWRSLTVSHTTHVMDDLEYAALY